MKKYGTRPGSNHLPKSCNIKKWVTKWVKNPFHVFRQFSSIDTLFLWYDILKSGSCGIIYTCKMIQPVIFSRFSQPVYFSRFKPDKLLLSTARFSGYNLEKCTG